MHSLARRHESGTESSVNLRGDMNVCIGKFLCQKLPGHPLFLIPASQCQRWGVATCIQRINLIYQRMTCGFACKLHEEKISKFQKETRSNSKQQTLEAKRKMLFIVRSNAAFRDMSRSKISSKGGLLCHMKNIVSFLKLNSHRNS